MGINLVRYDGYWQLRPGGAKRVKRDMDVIRAIIAEVESWPDLTPRLIMLDGYSDEVVNAHVGMMAAADLIRVQDVIPHGAGDRYTVSDLTWAGHEFAAAIRNDTVLNRLKTGLGEEFAKLPLQLVAKLSLAVAEAWAKEKLGLAG